jgi:hypothetical protein
MNKIKLKDYKFLIIILIISLIIRIKSLLTPHDLWWDSSVYIEMGKYLWSLGQVGIWEPNRPLIWSLLLGFFWKIKLDPILFGRIMVLFFSIGIIYLTYFISLKIFNKQTAIISSLLLSLFPTFIRFSNILFSEIPSTFFLILGIYYFFNKKYPLSGLILGIAFMTRFFQIFVIIPLLLVFFYYLIKKKVNIKQSIYFYCLFGLPTLIFLIINTILYKNPFEPIFIQAYMTRNTGWIFHQPITFYFYNLFKQNILVLFGIVGIIPLILKKNLNKIIILVLFLFPFILYVLERHKEMRLLINLLPFMFMLVALGINEFSNLFKKTKYLVLFLLIATWIATATPLIMFDGYNDGLDPFYNHIKNTKISEGIWISNPSLIVYTDKKADELIYYPLYYSKKAKDLQSKVDKAKLVMFNTCDIIPCPDSDTTCPVETAKLLNMLNATMENILYQETGSCKYYIFESQDI